MADERLDGLFDSLEVTLDAAIAREEEEAADDLAMSLRQGRSLRDVLARGSWHAVLASGLEEVIEVLGRDFVATGGAMIPLARLRVRSVPAVPRPRQSEATFVESLRSFARSGRALAFATAWGEIEGPVEWVGTDHVAVAARTGLTVLPLHALALVRPGDARS